MRELKGDWRDLFKGFMIALDLRKMFLSFVGLVLSLFFGGWLTWLAAQLTMKMSSSPFPQTLQGPPGLDSVAPGKLIEFFTFHWDFIFFSDASSAWIKAVYLLLFGILLFVIWSLFGGAVARIAAYEIARDGERIETKTAAAFAGNKFWAFLFAPVICVAGFMLFYLCNFVVGFVGNILDLLWVGGPLMALLAPLAILSGFLMALIVVGAVAGFPLFHPAVAVEGTDSFDAVSRGFSYIFSRPWHYLCYQAVILVYGILCVAFVYLFAVGMTDLGLKAGARGFDAIRFSETEDSFENIRHAVWSRVLSQDHANTNYRWNVEDILRRPHPYGRTMILADRIVKPRFDIGREQEKFISTTGHQITMVICLLWVLVIVFFSYGYGISYLISQQTMIYFLLRKKVDGIEMDEIFEDSEEEDFPDFPEDPDKPGFSGGDEDWKDDEEEKEDSSPASEEEDEKKEEEKDEPDDEASEKEEEEEKKPKKTSSRSRRKRKKKE